MSFNEYDYYHKYNLFKIRLRRCGYRDKFIDKHNIKYEQDINTQSKIKDSSIRCKINFNKSYNITKLYKNILQNNHKCSAIKTYYITGKKTENSATNLEKLHLKLPKCMMQTNYNM